MPSFTSDWFSHNIPSWQKLFSDLKWDSLLPKTVVEVGSFEGRSTIWILSNLLHHPSSRLYCVDTFQAEIEGRKQDVGGLFERFSANIRESPERNKVTVVRGESLELLNRLIAKKITTDFVYIDGSHLAPDVLQDLVLSFRVLKVGGLVICDDYLWSMERPGAEDVLNSPKIAIDAFTTVYRRKLTIVPKQSLYQLAFIKTAE